MIDLKTTLKYLGIVASTILIIYIAIEAVVFYNSNFKYSMAIKVKFEELGPIYSSMPVYYKGYKIGKTKNIEPSDDYKYTIVDVILYPKNLSLPDNVIAKVKKLDIRKNYIELMYPDAPSLSTLKNDSTIDGKTTADIESFMSAQIESGAFSSMSDNMNKTLNSVENTSDEVNGLIKDLRIVLKENRPNIKKSTDETREILENLNDISGKLDEALSEEDLNNITKNLSGSSSDIKGATANVLNITQNLDKATKNLDKTMSKLDDTMAEAHITAKNASNITCGIKQLLEKRFAGMRLFFGQPSNPKNYANCKVKNKK